MGYVNSSHATHKLIISYQVLWKLDYKTKFEITDNTKQLKVIHTTAKQIVLYICMIPLWIFSAISHSEIQDFGGDDNKKLLYLYNSKTTLFRCDVCVSKNTSAVVQGSKFCTSPFQRSKSSFCKALWFSSWFGRFASYLIFMCLILTNMTMKLVAENLRAFHIKIQTKSKSSQSMIN
jgi:hypothetical protein